MESPMKKTEKQEQKRRFVEPTLRREASLLEVTLVSGPPPREIEELQPV